MNKTQFLPRFHLFTLAKAGYRFNANINFSSQTPQANVGKSTLKQAAVLVPLFEKNQQLHILFTLRASHLKHHAGQVSFPGGKVEPTDTNLTATALREAEEEIGLSADNCQILGKLNSYQTKTGFQVHPIVALINHPSNFNIDENEVAEVFSVPLSFIINKNNHFTVLSHINGRQHPVTFMPYQHYNIWGATAAMLKDLAMHIKN